MPGKKKSVQDAGEQKPSEPEEAPAEAPGAPVVPEAAAPIQIPPKVLAQAKALGVDLQQIIDWAQSVEQKLAIAEENFKQVSRFLDRMEPLVKLGEQFQQRQTQGVGTTAGPQRAGSSGLSPDVIESGMRIAERALAGGGADEDMMKMQKQMMQLSIDSMRQGMDFTNAIKNAIVSKITSKAVGDIV